MLFKNRIWILTSKSSILNMFHCNTSLWIGKDWGNESSNASRAKSQVRIDNSNISKGWIQKISVIWSWYNSYHGLSLLEVVTWIQYRFKEFIVTYRKKCNLIWLCRIVLMKILNTAIFYWTRADVITHLMLTASK